jgi:TAT-translocated FGD2 family F420-dependent dehydrogenase
MRVDCNTTALGSGIALARSGANDHEELLMAQIGYVLSHEQFRTPELLEIGVAAEQAGFDMLWTSDHIHPWQDSQGHAGHAWITLAALGQRTRHIPFGTGVTCPTYRYHPAVVAHAFASLAVLYPGRVFLGVGTGEALNEQAATGAWGDYDERAERFVEAVQLIKRLWAGEHVTHRGAYYSVESLRLYDTPETPVPLYMAAEGPNSMRLAGAYGDGLITDAQSATQLDKREPFAEGARAAGKRPEELPIHAELFVYVGTRQEAEPIARQWRFLPRAWSDYVNVVDPREIDRRAQAEVPLDDVLAMWTVSPDPAAHVARLQELVDGGVTHIYVHAGNADQQRAIAFYRDEVLPKVRGERARSA